MGGVEWWWVRTCEGRERGRVRLMRMKGGVELGFSFWRKKKKNLKKKPQNGIVLIGGVPALYPVTPGCTHVVPKYFFPKKKKSRYVPGCTRVVPVLQTSGTGTSVKVAYPCFTALASFFEGGLLP